MNLFKYTYDLVRQIPPGKISSYGAVAKALGDNIASRAVGRMMNQNPNADTMPCYKIVHSDGRLGGFGLGTQDKIRRLQNDNVQVQQGKIIDFDNVFFNDFTTEYPLKKMQKQQQHLSTKVKTMDDFDTIETVAGIDVAYPPNEFENAYGAYVCVDYKTHEILEEKTMSLTPEFPYIPTYFSYRELPIITEVFKYVDHPPSILLIDSNGILHPRGCGLATHAGIHLNTPTIGVAKKLLTGEIQSHRIILNNKPCGYALSSSSRATHPIYISPGHRVSMNTSKTVVQQLCRLKNPEPLRRAHQLAKKTLQKNR